MFKRLWESRFLVMTLTRRQYQIRYRQSFAGYLWAIVPNLGILAVGSLVFGQIAGMDSGDEPYSVVTMAALVPWTLFASSVGAGVPIVYASSNMITRLSFPRVALPLSAISTSLVSLAISAVMFLFFSYVFGSGLPATAVWFPAILILELLFVVGVVLLGSAMDVFARDVRLAVPIVVQLWLLITPVIYAMPDDHPVWYTLNPMVGIVESSRRVLVHGQPPTLDLLLPAMVGAAALLFGGLWYFSASERKFADVV